MLIFIGRNYIKVFCGFIKFDLEIKCKKLLFLNMEMTFNLIML